MNLKIDEENQKGLPLTTEMENMNLENSNENAPVFLRKSSQTKLKINEVSYSHLLNNLKENRATPMGIGVNTG